MAYYMINYIIVVPHIHCENTVHFFKENEVH